MGSSITLYLTLGSRTHPIGRFVQSGGDWDGRWVFDKFTGTSRVDELGDSTSD